MFRFTQKPSSGSYSQCLAKITHVVNRICIKAVQGVVSAMAAYCDLESVCVVRCATVYWQVYWQAQLTIRTK